jgi:hypothetical protein
MGRTPGVTQDRVAKMVGLTMGAATGMTLSSLISGFDDDPKAPSWIGLAVSGAVLLAMALRPAWRESRVLVICVGFLPVPLAGTAVSLLDLSRTTASTVRAIGFLISVALFFGIAYAYSRRKREVDQLIFREAAIVAFFATMIAAVVYGTLTQVTDVPRLSFAALAVFGMCVWLAALFVFDKRYS